MYNKYRHKETSELSKLLVRKKELAEICSARLLATIQSDIGFIEAELIRRNNGD